jgi:CRISPR-associated protein Cas1
MKARFERLALTSTSTKIRDQMLREQITMAILYITEQGATVGRTDGRLLVTKEKRVIDDLPAFKVEGIVAFGNVHLTPTTIAFCLQQGIEVSFLSMAGVYRGRLQPEFTKNVVLRQQQYLRAADAGFCRAQAVAIVAGKRRNMVAMIQRQRRLRNEGRSPVAELEAIVPRLAGAPSLESLNGYEGTASAAYFRSFRAALKEDWGFTARIYHPPTDPVNVLLSLGYTLLYNNVLAAASVVGFDPYMGYFHRPRQGHAALASDLMEEHRSVVVDPLVLTALNKRMLVKQDFRQEPTAGVRLATDALKRFLGLYAARINETVSYPAMSIRTTYRQVIELQARQFARVVLGEETVYRPYSAELATQAK